MLSLISLVDMRSIICLGSWDPWADKKRSQWLICAKVVLSQLFSTWRWKVHELKRLLSIKSGHNKQIWFVFLIDEHPNPCTLEKSSIEQGFSNISRLAVQLKCPILFLLLIISFGNMRYLICLSCVIFYGAKSVTANKDHKHNHGKSNVNWLD